jgi:3-hydroxybutyryl-CoA dehydrogenase
MSVIGIVGLGTMGLGIAQVFAAAGYKVLATDAVDAARATAATRLRSALEPRVAKGALSQDALEAALSNLHIVPTPQDLSPATLIIEAILETLPAKQALFTSLEACIPPQTILATNTSSLSVAAIAQGLKHPERVLGLHFFNPAPAMKLVELVAHAGTNAAALTLARMLNQTAGKTVITCPDRPGFIVNRCARPFYGEALALLEEGRTPSDIDASMLAAGYKIGPLSLIDLIGADINLAATQGLQAARSHPRYHVFDALKAQVAAGHLGRKSGQGFLFPAQPGPPPADAAAIALRIEATLANEATWLLAEGGVSAEGIDQALKLGLNLPRGPFEITAQHTAEQITATLAELESKAPAHLKSRYLQPA